MKKIYGILSRRNILTLFHCEHPLDGERILKVEIETNPLRTKILVSNYCLIFQDIIPVERGMIIHEEKISEVEIEEIK